MNQLAKKMKKIAITKKTSHKMNKIIMRLIMMIKMKRKMKNWMKNQIRIFQTCNKKTSIRMQFKKIKTKINQMKITKKMQGMNREIYNNS